MLYDDAQFYRLGANFKQLYINCPHATKAKTMNVMGLGQNEISNKFPHYYPNSFGGPLPDKKYMEPPMKCDGAVGFYDYTYLNEEADYYEQPRMFWR
jgi:catalase